MADKKTKFEQSLAHAKNMMSFYSNLDQLKDLFDRAVQAEQYLAKQDKAIEQAEKNLEAVEKAVRETDGRYSNAMERIQKTEDDSKHKMVRREQEIENKFQENYGKAEAEAKRTSYNIGLHIKEKQKRLKELENQLTDLNEKVALRQNHLDRVNTEINKLKEVIVS